MKRVVKCMLCSQEFDAITASHLRSAHNTTTSDYRELFSDVEFRVPSEETNRLISESEKGKVVSEEVKQRLREINTGKVASEETRRSMSMAAARHWQDPEIRERMLVGLRKTMGSSEYSKYMSETMKACFADKVMSEETKRKLGDATSKALTVYYATHEVSDGTRQLISEGVSRAMTKEVRQAIREAMIGNQNALGTVCSEETKQAIRDTLRKLWEDPKFVASFSEVMSKVRYRKPNERELQLLSVLDKHFPGEWKYVGDNQFWLGKYNPDFMNVNSKKLLIEVFGYHWHDPAFFPNRPSEEELIAYYKKYGFDCLVFWEYDVYNEEEVVARVRELNEKVH